MLFLKYIWVETTFRFYIPLVISTPFLITFFILQDFPLPWLSVFLMTIVGLMVEVGIQMLVILAYTKLYDNIWKNGYLPWKRKQDLPPTYDQRELENIHKILARYVIEVNMKKNNSTAAKIYQEYQLVLALSDGIAVFDDIKLNSDYRCCLKLKDEL